MAWSLWSRWCSASTSHDQPDPAGQWVLLSRPAPSLQETRFTLGESVHVRAPRTSVPPLQYAAYNISYDGSEPILALVEAGAELDASDEKGFTALHQAVSEDESEMYALLVHAGANKHISTRCRRTPARFFEDVFGVTYTDTLAMALTG